MPEVCEVCITSQYLWYYLQEKQLYNIDILSGRYKKNGIKNLNYIMENMPLTITKIDSYGKFMWIELNDNKNSFYIMNTFGLTGKWIIQGNTRSPEVPLILSQEDFKEIHNGIPFNNFVGETKSGDLNNIDIENISLARILFQCSGGINVYYLDQRNFGTIIITDNKDLLKTKINSLEFDLLKTEYNENFFYNFVNNFINHSKKNKKIIEILMEQKKKRYWFRTRKLFML